MARATSNSTRGESREERRDERRDERRERQYIDVTSWDVARVRVTGRGNVFFTLILNGVSISNCHIAETRDGQQFISMPQYKGSDGNYYSTVYAPMTDKLQAEIIDAVRDEAGGDVNLR